MAFFDILTGGLGSLVGGLVGGASSLIGNSMGNKAALQAVREQNQANKELADTAFQHDIDMWERQNNYNLPINQIQRMKDAGLNPNLFYGQGNPGNAQTAPSYNSPNMSTYTGFGDFGATAAGQQLIQGLNGYAQIEKTNAETDFIRQNIQNLQSANENTQLRNIAIGLANSKTSEELKFYSQMLEANLNNTIANTGVSKAREENIRLDSQKAQLLMPYIEQDVKATIANKLKDLGVKDVQIQKLYSDMRFQEAMTDLTEMRYKAIELETTFNEDTYYSRVESQNLRNDSQRLANRISNILIDSGINLKSGGLTGLIHSFSYITGKYIDGLFQ